jgi:hypothetical protein
LPTFIALVLGLGVSNRRRDSWFGRPRGCACPGRIWCRCHSRCVRFHACIIRPAGLICIGIGWVQTGQTCWEHFAITRLAQMSEWVAGLDNPPPPPPPNHLLSSAGASRSGPRAEVSRLRCPSQADDGDLLPHEFHAQSTTEPRPGACTTDPFARSAPWRTAG